MEGRGRCCADGGRGTGADGNVLEVDDWNMAGLEVGSGDELVVSDIEVVEEDGWEWVGPAAELHSE